MRQEHWCTEVVQHSCAPHCTCNSNNNGTRCTARNTCSIVWMLHTQTHTHTIGSMSCIHENHFTSTFRICSALGFHGMFSIRIFDYSDDADDDDDIKLSVFIYLFYNQHEFILKSTDYLVLFALADMCLCVWRVFECTLSEAHITQFDLQMNCSSHSFFCTTAKWYIIIKIII